MLSGLLIVFGKRDSSELAEWNEEFARSLPSLRSVSVLALSLEELSWVFVVDCSDGERA